MTAWGFTMAELNTCLNVLESICDNSDLLEEPAIRGIRQLINPAMLGRAPVPSSSSSPKQDLRISGGAPIPSSALKAPKYGAGGSPDTSSSSSVGPKYGQPQPRYGAYASPAQNGTFEAPRSASTYSSDLQPKGGTSAYTYNEPQPRPSSSYATSSSYARDDSQSRASSASRAPKYGAPRYGSGLSSTAPAGYNPGARAVPAPSPYDDVQPLNSSTASPPSFQSGSFRTPKYGGAVEPKVTTAPSVPQIARENPSKVVNLTSKLRQTKRPGELSFSPKSPAVGYEHLW
jgi:hypothetical protein